MTFPSGQHEYMAAEISLDRLTPEFLRGWQLLARNAIEPNPFLEPEFVLAQAKYLDPHQTTSLWTVQNSQGEPVLILPARPVMASSQIPFPHLNDQLSPYQFQGGMLLHQQAPRAALITLLQSLKSTRFRHGMLLNTVGIDTPFSNQLYVSAALTNFQVQIQNTWSRAILNLQELDRSRPLEDRLSRSRRKTLRRARARLSDRGPVSFRTCETVEEVQQATQRFLELEHQGWKRAAGTAIACDSQHQAFFGSLMESLTPERKVLFGELLVGDRVVASTCNLIANSTLFAFKIGWDEDFKDGSPGSWAELELANFIALERPEITLLNSCSSAGSYLDRLWPHRMVMGNLVLSQSHRAVLYSGVRKSLRFAKQWLWPPAEVTTNELL